MSASKVEIGAYVVGGLTLGGALLMYLTQRHRNLHAPMMIFGGGALATGGAMTIYRKKWGDDAVRAIASKGLGLHEVGRVHAGGMTLTKWDDKEMGLDQRVTLLQGLVAQSVDDPVMTKVALSATQKCPPRDDKCELRAIYDYVVGNVRYTGDIGEHVRTPGEKPEAVDRFQTAMRTLEFRGGDCDDHSVATAAIAALNGFSTRFRITSNTGESWDHIYTLAGVPKLRPKKWIPIDTTLGPGKFGKQPAFAKKIDYAA